ncbi:glutamate-rich protein 6 isoform X2 [Hyla sarda]|uniref:glutamate-rich protein 6 isoform X2 n=1 Tax=Hyla sarda TaxID=327740 RepID=UPI0024C407DB|nr:glutamate-rich protein 6 isoform X2 [Hyla sarda]
MEGKQEETREPGALIFPRAIMRVRREEDSPSIEKETPHAGFKEDHSIVNHEHNLGNNEADSPDMIIQSAGNLYPVTEQEEDLYSSLSDDLSELSVLCDMEFSHDYRTFFEKHLKTLPSVGPPSVLAYKRESSENHRLLAMMKILREQSEKELCEFCGKTLKPFPLEHTIDKEFSNEIFCCRQFRNMFRYLFKEDERLFHKDKIELISVAPHGPYGSEVERQKAKEKTAQRLRERHMAKVFESIVAEPTIVNEYGRPMKTISYQLSSAPPVGDSWTIPPDNEDAKSDADSIDQEPVVYDFSNDTMMLERFVEKYYSTGRKFLTIFPDGTAQIFYPSGNLAIIIIPSKIKDSICIVQEDKDHSADILAVFGSSGKATCYHSNRNIWINVNPVGGQYSDGAGRRVRRWQWRNPDIVKPCAPFKPIFLALNYQVGVRIFGQDQMYVTFLAMGKQAKFSVGAKKLTSQVDERDGNLLKESAEDELMLLAIKIKFLSLLNKCHECLNFPSRKQWDNVKPPSFLVAQAQKLIYLCSVCDINKDVWSSIQNILSGYVPCDLSS